MSRTTPIVLAAIASALGACASGPSARERNAAEPAQFVLSADALLFVGFDADADLAVTMDEVAAGAVAAFARADTSADGKLGPVEFADWSRLAMGGAQLPPYRLDFDRNVDNDITSEEFSAELIARAKEYDQDQDGKVSRAEFVRPAPWAGRARVAPRQDLRENTRPPG